MAKGRTPDARRCGPMSLLAYPEGWDDHLLIVIISARIVTPGEDRLR
jgi:hypothetical protein